MTGGTTGGTLGSVTHRRAQSQLLALEDRVVRSSGSCARSSDRNPPYRRANSENMNSTNAESLLMPDTPETGNYFAGF